jgi:hypothetical protein
MVTYDHQAHGLLDRTTSLLHRVPRALTADLMRFRAYAEMTGAQSGTDGEREQQADEPRARHDEGE